MKPQFPKTAEILLTVILCAAFILLLTGCRKVPAEPADAPAEITSPEAAAPKASTSAEFMVSPATAEFPAATAYSASSPDASPEAADTIASPADALSYEEIVVPNPGWQYYASENCNSSENPSLSLQLIEQSPNQYLHECEALRGVYTGDDYQQAAVDLYYEWFDNHGVTTLNRALYDQRFNYEDERYRYEIYNDRNNRMLWPRYKLELTDKSSGVVKVFDFRQYLKPPEGMNGIPEDRFYEEPRAAGAVDNVLYVGITNGLSAEDCKWNDYIVAIDLANIQVLWKSDPLINNSLSFAIVGNCIVTGYGFTGEDDYLNILDIGSGRLIEKIPIDSQAEQIIYDDGLLYVRTYNYDTVYSCGVR